MSRLAHAAKHILRRIDLFSAHVLGMKLRRYQSQPLTAVIDSVLQQAGREYLLVFPRQSGKNEAAAHLIVYLLNVLQRTGGNIVFAAVGDAVGRGVQRLEQRLDNPWNAGRWSRGTRPTRRTLGAAAAVFISSSPQAASRGETAHWLLIIDELQDQDPTHLEAVFTPMRAANNATALYLGTVRTTTDALWRKKQELEQLQAADGIQRVFMVPPETVSAENPHYQTFLDSQVAKHGRAHPIVRSEYFLEPLDGDGGLFPPRRRALMHGRHPRQTQPTAGRIYMATLDTAGQDEAATDAIAQLANPGRDYTVATIWELHQHETGTHYHAVDILVDQGSRHFESFPGRPALAERLLAYLQLWNVGHVVADATGVGEGLTNWLSARLPGRVTGFKFTRHSKAWLGSSFITLIETGRVKYWQQQEDYDDAWLYFEQMAHTAYVLPAGGAFDRDLRWHVPPGTRISTPTGSLELHDDRLLSAALVAELDRLAAAGLVSTGRGESVAIPGRDPLAGLKF